MRFVALPAAMLLSACGGEAQSVASEQAEESPPPSKGVLNDAVQYCAGGENAPVKPDALVPIADGALPKLVRRFVATEELYEPDTARIAKFEREGAEVWVLRESAAFECGAMLTKADDHYALLQELLSSALSAPSIDDPTFEQGFWALPISVETFAGDYAYTRLQGSGKETAKADEIQLTMSVVRPDKIVR